MSTKSSRSSGTQITQRGVNQGTVLVDPITGLPIDVIEDNAGTKRLAVDANITIDSVTITTDDLNATDDAVRIEDPNNGNHVKVNADGSIDANVEVDAADGDNIAVADAVTGSKLKVEADGSINTNVAGVATEAKQDSQLTSLTSIDTKLASIDAGIPATLGQQTATNSMPVVIASNQSAIPTTVASLPLPTGAATEAKQDSQLTSLAGIDSKLASIDAGIPATLGQQPMASSLPVVLSGDQTAIPTTVASLPLPSGAATEAKQDTEISSLTTINATLTSIDSGIPTALGQQTMANSMSVVLASNQTVLNVNATLVDEPIKMSGTENGQPGGTEFVFVNNLKTQILAAKDREQNLSYADFGTKNQRITQIDYNSPSIGIGIGFVARKTINYTLIGNNYRRDSIVWSLV